MAKRIAATELTDRNWDQEDEPEEVGVFAQASTDILMNRPMKKAKRRTQNESAGSSALSAFGGFAGLGSKKPTQTITTEKADNASNGFTATATNKNTSYYHSLKSLNKSVLEWIKKHIERDPYCILTPIFTDYSKHLEDIKKTNNNNEVTSDSFKGNLGNDSDPEIVFNTKKVESLSPVKEKAPASSIFGNTGTTGFSFSSSTTTSDSNVTSSTTTSTITTGFTFAPSSTSSSFGAFGTSAFTVAANKPNDNQEGEEEEYVPPKAETREINEEGAVYSKRCKIFYQKDGKWKDRGVGNLHLKPDDEGKTQLIIRADTTLGNILLNIMLSSVIPTKKQGKNNVWMLCVPNPPIDVKDDSGKPVPMLLRVKSSEDADELLDKLEELKK